MNWGYRIVIVFVLFMGFVISVVVYTSTKASDLVADDYYMQEVNYQGIIDARTNSKEIKNLIELKQDANQIQIVFPEVVGDGAVGTIHFFHPQSEVNDVVSELNLSAGHLQVIDKTTMVKGNYTVKIKWQENGKNFYVEKSCYVS